jgi:primosomal protein N' (replication factor Y) (superfamily II helicase)
MLYADVCVNTPLGARVGISLGADSPEDPTSRTFTYAVPERLVGRLQPGHLAWVVFRGRRLQAVVMAIGNVPPKFDTLDIEAVVWSQPPLTLAQLKLARWISAYYMAPLIEALRLMLPVGISQRGRTVLVRTADPVPLGLTPTQTALLERIAQEEGAWAEVTEDLRGVTQQKDLEPLIDAGLVTREVAFLTPPPHPKFLRQVRLLVDAATVAAALPTLGHPSKQADALAWLVKQTDPLPTLHDLCAAVSIGEATVRGLAERGWVRIIPKRITLRRLVSDADLPLAQGKLARAPRQVAALVALPAHWVDETEFRAAHGVDAATLRTLADKGLIERLEEPAYVTLTLDRAAALEEMIGLRGGARQRAVLEALLRHDGPAWTGWIYAETDADAQTLRDLEAAGLVALSDEMVWRDPLAGRQFASDLAPALTEDQGRVWEAVQAAVDAARPGDAPAAGAGDQPEPGALLLYGVTGSGKTEIYLRAIEETLRRGRQAVALVPEISLTPQTIRRFAARFGGRVTVWHSELSDGERFDVWRRVRTNHPAAQVVVGSRSALMLPYPDLGLIVLDEEHESSYKQERTPRYHTRTVAIELGRISGAPVVLGSATPALETFHAARMGTFGLLTLSRRIRTALRTEPGQPAGPVAHAELPAVQIVDMRQELRAGNRSMFSRPLSAALAQVLDAGQQAILYLNRRGTTTFILCRDCGHVETCPRCATPLAYHGAGNTLLCHHCNRRFPAPTHCPECHSSRIRYFGSGTQSLEDVVGQAFPEARVLRWDRDATGAKGSHDVILEQFVSHQADVLVGTQMIAKGLDLPLVTLVGVIAADIGLFLPDFRASERTFQLLTQVAGRAGRSELGGQVIVQTYHPEHYAIVAAGRHDYEGFYRQEMAFRREQDYPPFSRLAKLVYYHTKNDRAQAEANRLAGELHTEIANRKLQGLDLIGPAPCFFTQQRGAYRWQIVVRGDDPTTLLRCVSIPIGWRVDVDPVDLL